MNNRNIQIMREILDAAARPEIGPRVTELSLVSTYRIGVSPSGKALLGELVRVRFGGRESVLLAREELPEGGVSWTANGTEEEYGHPAPAIREALEIELRGRGN